MALTQQLQIRQSQALVMTPQLMQAIKLLQLSNLDLVAYVEAELERNPLLDRSAEDERPADKPSDATAAPDEPSVRGEAWNEGEGPRPTATPSMSASISPPTTSSPTRRRQAGRGPQSFRPDIPNGRQSAPAAAMTAITTSKRSSPPRPRWRTGCASSLRLPWPTRHGG